MTNRTPWALLPGLGPHRCIAATLAFTLAPGCGSPTDTGEAFFGQAPPGDTPVLFAPQALDGETLPHSRVIASPDGITLYWNGNPAVGIDDAVLFSSVLEGSTLSRPHRVTLAPPLLSGKLEFSAGGNRVFYSLRQSRPDRGGEELPLMAYVERTASGWSEPVTIIANDDGAWASLGQPSLTRDGTVYFAGRRTGDAAPRVLAVRPVSGAYGEPEELPQHINRTAALDPFVDPDGRFLLFVAPGHPGGAGDLDVWISFREPDGGWSEPSPVASVNSEHMERFPSVSADGRFLFFVRSPGASFPLEGTAFYWMSAAGLDRLAP